MGQIELVYSGIPDLLPQKRGAGIHLTSIIRALGIKYGYIKSHAYSPEPSETTKSRMQLGLTLEYALLQRMNAHDKQETDREFDRFVTVGEMESDGILMNLDFFDIVLWEPIECKLTWRSSAHDIAGNTFWRDWIQCACYARRMQSLSGCLALCHVDGDYKHPKEVHHNVWRQTWTQDELDDIWIMIVNHKHLAEPYESNE